MNMNMYVYRMTETPDSESVGEPGEPFEAFNLSEAKRISTRRQQVKGSVLVLEDLTSRPQGSCCDLHLRGAGRHMIPSLT